MIGVWAGGVERVVASITSMLPLVVTMVDTEKNGRRRYWGRQKKKKRGWLREEDEMTWLFFYEGERWNGWYL
jgi:hypothetical protein